MLPHDERNPKQKTFLSAPMAPHDVIRIAAAGLSPCPSMSSSTLIIEECFEPSRGSRASCLSSTFLVRSKEVDEA